MNVKKLFLSFFILSFFNFLQGIGWEEHFRTSKDIFASLKYIRDNVRKIEGLKVSEIPQQKINIESHLLVLQAKAKVKPELNIITKYLESEDGQKDNDFVALLMKTKKILEVWFGEKISGNSVYHDLWIYLNKYRPIPAPPMPPRPAGDTAKQSLKSNLLVLKKGLTDLRGKLQKLSLKLTALKTNLSKGSMALGAFDNSDLWWDAAVANPGKITQAHKYAIISIWEKIKQINILVPGGKKSIDAIFDDKQLAKQFRRVAKEEAKKMLQIGKLDKLSDEIFSEEKDKNDKNIVRWLAAKIQ